MEASEHKKDSSYYTQIQILLVHEGEAIVDPTPDIRHVNLKIKG